MTSKGAESVAGVGLQGSSIGRAAIAAQPVALALAYMSRRRWNHTGITTGITTGIATGISPNAEPRFECRRPGSPSPPNTFFSK